MRPKHREGDPALNSDQLGDEALGTLPRDPGQKLTQNELSWLIVGTHGSLLATHGSLLGTHGLLLRNHGHHQSGHSPITKSKT